jgi:hypothetical protein
MEANFFGFSWIVWRGLCWVIALVYSFIWPKHRIGAQKISTFRYFILRWFHAIVWILLGISCFIRIFPMAELLPNLIAVFAFGLYVIFLVVMSNSQG